MVRQRFLQKHKTKGSLPKCGNEHRFAVQSDDYFKSNEPARLKGSYESIYQSFLLREC
jgi:hypothetical protein